MFLSFHVCWDGHLRGSSHSVGPVWEMRSQKAFCLMHSEPWDIFTVHHEGMHIAESISSRPRPVIHIRNISFGTESQLCIPYLQCFLIQCQSCAEDTSASYCVLVAKIFVGVFPWLLPTALHCQTLTIPCAWQGVGVGGWVGGEWGVIMVSPWRFPEAWWWLFFFMRLQNVWMSGCTLIECFSCMLSVS